MQQRLGHRSTKPNLQRTAGDSSTVLVAATLIVSTGQHRRENLPRQNECVPSQQNGMDAPMKAADPYVSVK